MLKSLPIDRFKWLDAAKFNLDKYGDNSLRGCVLETDLEYLISLHELHFYYPLAPDKKETNREMISDYQLKITDNYNVSIGNAKKLVPNFFNKEKYVVHYKNLKLYLRLRLKIK